MSKWILTNESDVSWEHCGRPAYWEGDDVICSKCQEVMQESDSGLYTVTFIGEYFNLTTCIEASNSNEAIRLATHHILYQYGWDLKSVSNEVEVVLEGVYA